MKVILLSWFNTNIVTAMRQILIVALRKEIATEHRRTVHFGDYIHLYAHALNKIIFLLGN